jgi:hypothetical protein
MTPDQRTSGSPHEDLYDPAVAKVERVSAETVRKDIGKWVKQAAEGELDSHKLVGRHNVDELLIVDKAWYRRAREALGDPTDL